MPAPTIVTVPQLARRIGLPDAPVLIDVRTRRGRGRRPALPARRHPPVASRCRRLGRAASPGATSS